MDIELFKKYLGSKFYRENNSLVDVEQLPSESRSLWHTMSKHHEKFDEDISEALIMQMWRADNPAHTNALRGSIAIFIDNVVHADGVSDAVASDLLGKMAKNRRFNKAAEMFIRASEGEEIDLGEIRDIIDDEQKGVVKNYTVVECDIESFLFKSSPEGLYPFRMPGLVDKVPGAGPGNFIILFARPDEGKTSVSVFEAAGYADRNLKVAYFANEEPAHRVFLRLICSYLGMTQEQVSEDIKGAQKRFAKIAPNIQMLDCVGMDIASVDAYCAQHNPDVIFLDQLDKFGISGNFSRGDEKLGDLYTYTREIAKRNNVLVWGITQCSAEGQDMDRIHYSMIAGSKTGKAAEADLIIGVGHNPNMPGMENSRTLNISKNKLPGGFHGAHTVRIIPEIAGFIG